MESQVRRLELYDGEIYVTACGYTMCTHIQNSGERAPDFDLAIRASEAHTTLESSK